MKVIVESMWIKQFVFWTRFGNKLVCSQLVSCYNHYVTTHKTIYLYFVI